MPWLQWLTSAVLLPQDTSASSSTRRLLADAVLVAPPGMSRWSRLDRYGQALTTVVAQTLATDSGTRSVTTQPLCGLHVVSEYSCYETNAAFHRGLIQQGPDLASPLLFAYTLPGAAAAEVAAHFGLREECIVYSGGSASTLAAILAAADALSEGATDTAMVASADVWGSETLASRQQPQDALTEAAAAIHLGALLPKPIGPRVCIEGALGRPSSRAQDWRDLIEQATTRAGVLLQILVHGYNATSDLVMHASTTAALRQLGASITPHDLRREYGNTGATLGLIAVDRAFRTKQPCLVLAADSSIAAALIVTPD